jgi:hypothetical protein
MSRTSTRQLHVIEKRWILWPVSQSDQSTSLCNLANGLFTRFEQKLIKREVAETGTVVSGK